MANRKHSVTKKRKYATRLNIENKGVDRKVAALKFKNILTKSFFVFACVGVIASFMWLSGVTSDYVQNQKISVVRIEGELANIAPEEIQDLLSQFMRTSMVSIGLDNVRQTLLNSAWIKDARVSREWPETLVVTIEEQQAIARWNNLALVNQEAQLFQPEKEDLQMHLPLLNGPEDSAHLVMEQYQKFSQLLYPYGLKLSSLTLSERSAWQFELDNGVTINIGRNQVMDKMRRFVGFLDNGFYSQINQVETIDLRYNNGIAVLPASTVEEDMVSSL